MTDKPKLTRQHVRTLRDIAHDLSWKATTGHGARQADELDEIADLIEALLDQDDD